MKKLSHFLASTVGVLSIFATGSVMAEEITLPVAINNSIWLASASQRVTRAYTQIAMGVVPEKGEKVRAFASNVIKKNSTDLAAVAEKYTGSKEHSDINQSAQKLIQLTSGEVKKEKLKEINAEAERFMNEALQLSQALEKAGGNKAKVVAAASRVRMYSQRLGKLALLAQAGVENNPAEMSRLRNGIVEEIAFMESAPISTPAIKSNIDMLKQQWIFYDAALKGSGVGASANTNIATTSDRMFELSHQLAGQYEKALAAVN